jgi:hypothetical protein
VVVKVSVDPVPHYLKDIDFAIAEHSGPITLWSKRPQILILYESQYKINLKHRRS